MPYNHKEIEAKWQTYWAENETFKTDAYDFSKPKYYALDMFPYPSGQGLHAGHPEGYTATDILCRKRRMQGYNVLHPMGYDAFGLPAEQYAIQTGNNPATFTEKNIATFRKQLKAFGFSYDWNREISTADPKFYHWTQWIFKQLFEEGLAKCVDMPVNWCEELGTVLSNDEIIDGKSERGGYPVVRKNMKQWIIDIPAYAEKLLAGLNDLDWPESTKEMQRNWIGKSVGVQVEFQVQDSHHHFVVFTTRCDTLFGASYCVLSPEHELVHQITTPEQKEIVEAYRKAASLKSDLERSELNKEKTGVFTGAYAINPVNQKALPIWISDYVLTSYGTSAIMAVPAHDARDYAFAKKFGLEILPVLEGGNISEEAWEEDGLHINSDWLNGLNKEEAIKKMLAWLEEKGIGSKKVNYRIREWIFARQRYWGEPIPIVHLEDDRFVSLSDQQLPLLLPVLNDYKAGKDGLAPLAKAKDWVNVEMDGIKGQRETSTMPGSAGSSWYYLRYIDPNNDSCLGAPELLKHWMPVDLYVGGPEHAVGHLLYARMWNRFLYDKGIVPSKEPFQKLVHQGMILGTNGIKMGKRYPKFIVDPNILIEEYGADTVRVYEMFMGPLEASKPWSEQGVEGSFKWLNRVYRLVVESNKLTKENDGSLDMIYHATVKKVSEDVENLCFNTAISQMMIFINECYKVDKVYQPYIENFIKMFSCFAPHLGEELWTILTSKKGISFEKWPSYDETKLVQNTVTVVVQVNGKLRAKFETEKDSDIQVLQDKAIELVPNYTTGKQIVKVIVVPNKLVNIVVK
ncbi:MULTISPECIES: leucine--tRNA ligase [Terrabacteria group]|uniref:leucine--tRNA ligase n=1 Tax=Bacillati TaxID=1783272 RepID=UPI001C6E1235|nr:MULTISPECIES: leucine--tRNA ligase [Terrabacteria group]MBW9213055.1 leucine--tRNA ligase [Trueperella sp. zg.1013]